jgi:hypothetical protein
MDNPEKTDCIEHSSIERHRSKTNTKKKDTEN